MKKIFLSFLFSTWFCIFFYGSSPAKISVIYQVDESRLWETDWLSEVLSEVDHEVIYDGTFRVLKNHSIIVLSSCCMTKKWRNYLKSLRTNKYTFGIILLSDENYDLGPNFCKQAKFILRNYWHKNFLQKKNILAFPLGYKAHFWNGSSPSQIQPSSEREFT
jgi:hypothetical protein